MTHEEFLQNTGKKVRLKDGTIGRIGKFYANVLEEDGERYNEHEVWVGYSVVCDDPANMTLIEE